METGQLVDDTRKLLTRFFNGTDPDRLIFAYNSTDALNLALFGLLSARRSRDHRPRSSTTRCCARCITCRSITASRSITSRSTHSGFVDPDDGGGALQARDTMSSPSTTPRT